jgi:hypothetical protein
MARARLTSSTGPAPPAWLRIRRSPWPASSTATARLAPTPVVRPYTGRAPTTRPMTSRARLARSSPSGCTATGAPSRAILRTCPLVMPMPSTSSGAAGEMPDTLAPFWCNKFAIRAGAALTPPASSKSMIGSFMAPGRKAGQPAGVARTSLTQIMESGFAGEIQGTREGIRRYPTPYYRS